MRILVAACSLGLCMLAGVSPANATIFTITVSGPLTSGVDNTNYFGTGLTNLTGDSAVFTYVINTNLLGSPSFTETGNAIWVYSSVSPTPVNDSPQCPPCSSVPIGISDSVTINGVTLATGLDRQLLDLQYLDPNASGANVFEVTADNKNDPTDDPGIRDYVALTLQTFDNPFFPYLDPNNIGDLSIPECNVDNGDSLLAAFRGADTQDSGFIDLCSSQASFSITEQAPEPMTIALFGAGLIGLGALRRRQKGRKAA